MSLQPLKLPTSQPLILSIRALIRREGPISFARFMEQALYHSGHGYYSSGRCAIGRRGDYFTSVSVGPLFGKLMAAQFVEIWERLGQPHEFVIVEQGAHHGEFAHDVLEAIGEQRPEFFVALRYRIIEPFSLLRDRQAETLCRFAEKMEWRASLEEMESFCGVHFSNELLDAMPVHLLHAIGESGRREWRERLVEQTSSGFAFVSRAICNARLQAHLAKVPPPPPGDYETEINLRVLDWVEMLARKLVRGVVFAVDYGFPRRDFYSAERNTGTLQCYAEHRVLPSPLERIGECDLTTHVEWTSVAERAEECDLTIAGFTDQHHFLTGLLAAHPPLAALATAHPRALQTLLHPEFLGTKFQFLGLVKGIADQPRFAGFQFARDSRAKLGLAKRRDLLAS